MAFIPDQMIDTGSYVPTTQIWETSDITSLEVSSPEFKELLVRLYQNINTIALVLNTKVSGYFINQEFASGKLFTNPATNDPMAYIPGYVINILTGALGAGITAVNHGLTVTNLWKWISISGAATDSIGLVGYPITYGDPAGNNIGVTVSATQVIINNASGIAFTSSNITLEYIKY